MSALSLTAIDDDLMNPEERNRDADGEHTIESSVGLSKSEN
jgi:hypothetical protein